MALQDISPVTVDIIYKELGLTEQDVKDYVKMLKEWLHKQPHLPQVNGR
jgi:predicted transcriptional regulator